MTTVDASKAVFRIENLTINFPAKRQSVPILISVPSKMTCAGFAGLKFTRVVAAAVWLKFQHRLCVDHGSYQSVRRISLCALFWWSSPIPSRPFRAAYSEVMVSWQYVYGWEDFNGPGPTNVHTGKRWVGISTLFPAPSSSLFGGGYCRHPL